MAVLQGQYLAGNVLRRVAFCQSHFALVKDVPLVVRRSDPMDGHARATFSCGVHGPVNMHAKHALASVKRQKCRMDIHHPLRVSLTNFSGQTKQKPSKGDPFDAALPQLRKQCPRIQGLFGHMAFRNAMPLGVVPDPCVLAVGDNPDHLPHFGTRTLCKVRHQAFRIGASS